jgi:hypothetical protein
VSPWHDKRRIQEELAVGFRVHYVCESHSLWNIPRFCSGQHQPNFCVWVSHQVNV